MHRTRVRLVVGAVAVGGRYATCARETTVPIGLAHVVHTHLLAGLGGMDELVVTHVDAHMAEGLTHGVEEHQVTGF